MPITGAPPAVPVAVRVYRTTDQSIGTGAWVTIVFDAQRWDDPDDDQWEGVTNPSRLTCRYAGPYVIFAGVLWHANATGRRHITFWLNGTVYIAEVSEMGLIAEVLLQSLTTTYKLSVGDYLELRVFQDTGANLSIGMYHNVSPEFSMVRCV